MNHRIIIASFSVLCVVGAMNAQVTPNDPTALTQEINYYIDEVGDAKVEINMKMNAMQWQAFKKGPAASNPSIFRRDMERQMAAYLLENFKTELDEMNRASKTTVTARGLVSYKGNGNWVMKLGLRNPNVTKISDTCYLITGNMFQNGALIQQLQKIFFPKEASNIKQDTDTFGNPIFTYDLNVEPAAWNAYTVSGSLLILASAGLFLRNRKQKPGLVDNKGSA